jgi:hypothetical protein
MRLQYKDTLGTFVYDEANNDLYLNGTVSFAGTLYIDHIKDGADISVASDSGSAWVFPSWSHALLAFYAVGIHSFNGALIGGDSISNNVFTLFSGFDDDGSPIENYWQDGQQSLGTDNLKVAHRMVVKGLIQMDQIIAVYLILDDGTPVHVFDIEGDGAYVDQGINTTIGSQTIGSNVIGGGGEVTAHPVRGGLPNTHRQVRAHQHTLPSSRYRARSNQQLHLQGHPRQRPQELAGQNDLAPTQ